MAQSMRAWEIGGIGRDFVSSLFLNDSIPRPSKASLSEDQMIVQVITAAINPVDYKLPEADWFGRTLGMERGARLGLDFCGRIIAKHDSNSEFTEGQLVFGSLRVASRLGSLGEFLIVARSECAILPDGIDPDQAAAVGTAAGTAWQSLLPKSGAIKMGSKIFINGGSGGVGTFAIQFAKILGATVTTTCSTSNIELCRQLGADEVLDYKKRDIKTELSNRGAVYDMFIDNVGTDLYGYCHTFLKPLGTYVQVAANPTIRYIGGVVATKLGSFVPGPKQRAFHFVMHKADHDDYVQFGQWLLEGKLRAVVDTPFNFDNVPAAFKKLKEGHVKGKLIVHISK